MFKYLQITNWIERKIKEGTFLAGERLPTEMELMDQFQVSRQSVRRALAELENKRVIYSIQGSGTYVSDFGTAAADSIPDRKERCSNQIAVVLADHQGYFYPQKITGIYEVLEQAGYTINLFFTSNSTSKELSILESVLKGNYAGMLIDGTQSAFPRLDPNLFRKVIQRIPCVMMESRYSGYGLPCVALDDELGGYIGTKHLISNGHRKIAFVGRSEYRQSIKRGIGFTRAMKEAGIPFSDENFFWYTLNSYQMVLHGLEKSDLVRLVSNLTAIMCYNDSVAYNIIRQVERIGIRIPEDLSIVGYDNVAMPDQKRTLTSINHPKRLLGRKAAENLLHLMRDPSFEANYTFHPELVQGETVRKLN